MPGPQSFLQMSRDVSHSLQDGTRGEKATGDDMPWLSQVCWGRLLSSKQDVGGTNKHQDKQDVGGISKHQDS